MDDVNKGGIPGDEDFLEAKELLPVQLLIGLVGVDPQGKENAVGDDLLDLGEHIKVLL